MKVFIYACEGTFWGSHGVNEQCVIEVSSVEEVEEIGNEMSMNVSQSYEYMLHTEEEDEEPEFIWYAWKIRDDVTESVDELDAIAGGCDYKSFVEEYCGEEIE